MKKTWDVTADGVKHTIEYKSGFSCAVTVDGEKSKLKSSNWCIVLIDHPINFGNTQCRLVAIGNKVDLAVNGTYLGSGAPYEPVSNSPSWIYILVALSMIGGYFFGGILCLLIGLVFSMLYVQLGIKGKTGAVIGSFIGCSAIQLAYGFLLIGLMASI